jgi:hypothetical protein
MPKMNKREAKFVSANAKALEAELEKKTIRTQNTYAVDAGRDPAKGMTPWQQSALGLTDRFSVRNGFRRRHPYSTLGDYATLAKTNPSPKTHWEQSLDAEQERTKLPKEVAKQTNKYIPSQMGLVTTALENYAASKSKLNSIVAVGV